MTTGLSPMTPEQVPLHFMADYCLRCGTVFRDGQWCRIVRGGSHAKYRAIGLLIDEACLQPPQFDVPVGVILHTKIDQTAPVTGWWPRYLGSPPDAHGFAKVSMLDNGLAFVGLHRGHVEVWRRREVRDWGGVHGSYSADYGLYMAQPGLYHSVIDVRFYDLATPIPPARAMTKDENRFVAGGLPAAGCTHAGGRGGAARPEGG